MEGALEILKAMGIEGVGLVFICGVMKAALGGHDDSNCGY